MSQTRPQSKHSRLSPRVSTRSDSTRRVPLSAALAFGMAVLACGRTHENTRTAPLPAPLPSAPEAAEEAAPVVPSSQPSHPEPRPTVEETVDETAEKTVGIVELQREGLPRVLGAVRAASNAGYDRVVFEFRDGVPGYHLEYIDTPVRDCGAGDVKPIEGDAWLEVRFYPANAHTEQGEATVRERELRPGLSIVREVERTCDFEGVVTWVIGATSPNRYRAFELAAPPRLVVDIDH